MLRIPENETDISTSWLSQVLENKIIQSSFTIIPKVNDGTGYMSAIVGVEFQFENEAEPRSIVLKMLPAADSGKFREEILADDYDRTEIQSYNELIPTLIGQVPDLEKYICDKLYAEIQEVDESKGQPYNSILILKNLKPEGYLIMTAEKNWPAHYFMQGLDFLANFHGASLILEKTRESTIPKIFPWLPKFYNAIGFEENAVFPSLYTFFNVGFTPIGETILKNPNLPNEIVSSMKIIEKSTKQVFRAIMNAGQEFPSLIHGDLWTQNILVKDDDSSPIKVIDWQLLGYTDPSYDLAIYLLYCLPMESLNLDGLRKAVKNYYLQYLDTLAKQGTNARRTLEEFEKFFFTFGLAYGFVVMMGSQPFLDVEESGAGLKLQKIFEIFVELKLMDFIVTLTH